MGAGDPYGPAHKVFSLFLMGCSKSLEGQHSHLFRNDLSAWDTLKEEKKLEEANTRIWPFGEKAEKERDTHGELPNYYSIFAK